MGNVVMKYDWFVYAHYTGSSKLPPFYIGIGKIKGRELSLRNRNIYWRRVTLKNKGYMCRILFRGLSMSEAHRIEKELILKYGRVDLGTGTLVNLTAGGQGVCGTALGSKQRAGNRKGCKHTESAKLRMSKAKKGRPALNKGVKASETTKAKIREARKRQIFTAETRLKLSLAGMGRKHSEESKKRIAESMNQNIYELKIEEMCSKILGRYTGPNRQNKRVKV